MQFLKTLFWVVLAVVMVLFARDNWHVVSVNLWAGLVADVKLPILVLFALLLGFVPTVIIYRARIWSLQTAAGHAEPEQCRTRRRAQSGADADPPHLRAGRPGSRRARCDGPGGDGQQGLADRMTSPVYVALDTPDLDQARAIAARVQDPCRRAEARPRILLGQRPRRRP